MPKKIIRGKRSIDRKQSKDIKKLKAAVKTLYKADELKYSDFHVQVSPNSTNGTVTEVLNLPVFAGDNGLRHKQRQGSSINLMSFRARGLVQLLPNAASPDFNNRVRVLVVFCPNDTTPVTSNILQTFDIDSFLKIKPKQHYKVMYDRIFNVQNNKSIATQVCTEPVRIPINISLGKKHFGKSGAKVTWLEGQAQAPPTMGSLSIVCLSDSLFVTHPVVYLQTRTRYLDN